MPAGWPLLPRSVETDEGVLPASGTLVALGGDSIGLLLDEDEKDLRFLSDVLLVVSGDGEAAWPSSTGSSDELEPSTKGVMPRAPCSSVAD